MNDVSGNEEPSNLDLVANKCDIEVVYGTPKRQEIINNFKLLHGE